jgi:hypothetical protein
VLLPASFVTQLPLVDRSVRVGTMNTPHGLFEVQEAQLAVSMRLGSFEFANPVIRFAESLQVATLGGQWLASFSVTYDLANGRSRLERPSRRNSRSAL